jgi:hypothetical protein
MEAGFVAQRGIDKAGSETFDRDGCGDAPAELGHGVPDHALLLDIEIVEGGHMAARGDHQVAGGEWAGMRFGGHEVCKRPGIFGGNRTIWAGRQTTLYLTVRR